MPPEGKKWKPQTETVAIAAVSLLSLTIFANTLVRSLFSAPEVELKVNKTTATTTTPLPSYPGTYFPPIRLHIPALGILAPVQEVGINVLGNMATPSNYSDVGWYKHGTIPGQNGSAVLAGHVDNGLGLPGVFNNLDDLKIGEEIFVESADGQTLRFIVTAIQTYPYREVPTETLFHRADTARLNLITCAGQPLPEELTYDARLIVFAEKRR